MGNLFKKKGFILILVTVLLIIVMGVASTFESFSSFISNVISVPLTPIQKFFSSIGREVDNVVSYFKDSKTMKEENEDLKERVEKLEQENRELQILRTKNEELREALNLKGLFDDFQIIGANVIAKDPGNWFDVFKVDVGAGDGVTVNCPVLSGGNGLVGRVLESQHTSSKIITIIDGDSVIDGWIAKETGGSVRIRGDMGLMDQGLCIMDYIPLEADVSVGDVIETSGLGGLYPKGIVIGKVIEVRNVNSEFKRYAIIEPAVNFKKLEEVFVLKAKLETAGGGNEN